MPAMRSSTRAALIAALLLAAACGKTRQHPAGDISPDDEELLNRAATMLDTNGVDGTNGSNDASL